MEREIEKKEFISFEDEYAKQKNQIYKQWLKFNLPNQYRDDVLQAGKIGLYLAMETYNQEKGVWSTWMIMYIRKEMMMFINRELRTVRLPEKQIYENHHQHNPDGITSISISSLDQPINEEESTETYADALADPDQKEFEFDTSDAIRELLIQHLSKLKPSYQNVIRMRYIEEKEYGEIAEILGISKEGVRDKNDRAIKQLQKMFNVEEKIHTKNKQINSPRKKSNLI